MHIHPPLHGVFQDIPPDGTLQILEKTFKEIKPVQLTLYDRVLVRRVEAKETAGGLFLPETAKEKPQQAEVIATGNGRPGKDNELVPLTVKTGDIVLFGKYAGDEINRRCDHYSPYKTFSRLSKTKIRRSES